jgi:uncharacterized coiled-coil DUF342 family protein
MIHIRIDNEVENSKRKFACGIGPELPPGDTYFFDGESSACRADCPGCNSEGPQPIGTPLSELSVEEAAEVEQLKAKLADEELICLRVIQDRDAAVEFCDLFASTILGEDINWSCHETKWQEALDMLSNGKTIEVSGIMLRRSGDYAIVEAEVDGKWREVISEFIDTPFSHIVEPAGILQSKESELNAVPDGVEAQPQPAPRYACSKLAAVGDRVKVLGSEPPLIMKVEEVSPTGGLYIKSLTGTACMLLNSSQVEFVPEIPPAATKWPRYFESKDARHDKSLRRVYHADGTCGWQDGNGSPMSTTLSEALQDDYMIETDADGNELKQPIAETKPVVAKYRSKPCVIEAIHYKGTKASFDAIYDWMDGDNVGSANLGYRGPSEHDPQEFGIKTLKGSMIATPGDWIIKGTHGEFYACKPEVFAVKYELVEATQPIPGEVAKVEHDHDQELAADHDAAVAELQERIEKLEWALDHERKCRIPREQELRAEIERATRGIVSLREQYASVSELLTRVGDERDTLRQLAERAEAELAEAKETNRKALSDRDMEWWEKLCLVDNVAPTPEAVKQWVMDENEYHEKQLRTKLAEVEKERDEANRTVNIVLSSLHWTGDGYEWTGGQYDYRMTPADALAATQGMLHQLRSAKKELTAQLAAANERAENAEGQLASYRRQLDKAKERIAALEQERDGLRELLDSCRAEVRCLYRQASGKDPSEATGSVRNVLERIQNAFALSQPKGGE